MAEEVKAPARPRKKRAAGTGDTRISLYPLSLEEAVDRLLKAKPEPPATRKSRKS